MSREIEGAGRALELMSGGIPHGSIKYAELNSVELAKMAAKAFSGRDWHGLNLQEKRLVKTLEDARYIKVNRPSTGFVGQIL